MEYQIRCGLQSVNPHSFVSFSLQSLLYSLSRTYAKYIWKCTKKKTHLCGNIAWARRVSWFPQVYCQTPTHLVQRCSELWHLHHANWCVYISMWTSLCWCAELECAFKSWFEHTHCCVCVCVLERLSDPVCCSLACGYLEVSADVVSACGSGFTIFSRIESCIHLADSSTARGRSFCLLSPFWCSLTISLDFGSAWKK